MDPLTIQAPAQQFAILIKIVDNFATTPDDVSRIVEVHYHLMLHIVDIFTTLEYPHNEAKDIKADCEYEWNQVRSSLIKASPESDEGLYPDWVDALNNGRTEFFLEAYSTSFQIRFMQQRYTATVMQALASSSRFPAPLRVWFAGVPQHEYVPLSADERDQVAQLPLTNMKLFAGDILAAVPGENLDVLTKVMAFFLELVHDACYCLERLSYVYDEARVTQYFVHSVNIRVGMWLCLLLDEVDVTARQALVTTSHDVEAGFRAMVLLAANTRINRPDELRYWLSCTFLDFAVDTRFDDFPTIHQYLKNSRTRDGFDMLELVRTRINRMEHYVGFSLNAFGRRIPTTPNDWVDHGNNDDEFDIGFEPPLLEDVPREAIGPMRPASICSTVVPLANVPDRVCCSICDEKYQNVEPVQEVRQVNCPAQHMFHNDCIEDLINGIEVYSNKCPNCRTVICEPRESRAVLSDSN